MRGRAGSEDGNDGFRELLKLGAEEEVEDDQFRVKWSTRMVAMVRERHWRRQKQRQGEKEPTFVGIAWKSRLRPGDSSDGKGGR